LQECSIKGILDDDDGHSFAVSFEPILYIPVEPWNHYSLYLTSPSVRVVMKWSSTPWPFALSLFHLLVPVASYLLWTMNAHQELKQ